MAVEVVHLTKDKLRNTEHFIKYKECKNLSLNESFLSISLHNIVSRSIGVELLDSAKDTSKYILIVKSNSI